MIITKDAYSTKTSPEFSPQREEYPISNHLPPPSYGCLMKQNKPNSKGLDEKFPFD
jgi:hypothetical protein